MRDLSSGFEIHRTERYVLHDAIARGGMASVHVGMVQGSFGFSRIVAIKRLHSQLASGERFVRMLIEEAHVSSRIRHVNVVPTLDVLSADGEVFIIMEYVRGASLSKLAGDIEEREGLVPVELVIPIMVGALHGLHAAHEATDLNGAPLGVVHRDVSPQNILVGISGVPRVIDFGVARAVGRGELTRDGEFKGKLSYAAPEQLTGAEATPRTDVFAAGVVLWELLTGARLFSGQTDLETFHNVLHGAIPDPRTLANDRMREQRTPEQIDAIAAVAMRALERDPAARFATAAEMANALEAAASSAPLATVGAWVQRVAATKLFEEQAIISKVERSLGPRTRGGDLPSADRIVVGDALGAETPAKSPAWAVETPPAPPRAGAPSEPAADSAAIAPAAVIAKRAVAPEPSSSPSQPEARATSLPVPVVVALVFAAAAGSAVATFALR